MKKGKARIDPAIARISMDALDALLKRCAERLPAEDHALLASLVAAFSLLVRMVHKGQATLNRLRRLFGLRKSEKKSSILSEPDSGNAGNGNSSPQATAAEACSSPDSDGAGASSPPSDAAPGDADPKEPPKGHGRLGAAAYKVEATPVSHESLDPGAECPACKRGALYKLNRPELIVRIFGQAPLFAKSWACQRLRCSGCQKVFTAKHPPEACGPKFSASAVAAIAVLRFWLGTPHYRLERAQEALGTPIPDSTQWEVLYARSVDIEPAYQHLLHLGAQASILHVDDTHMLVLQYTGKRREKLVEEGKLPRVDRTGLFTTGIVAITAQGPLALFITGRRHAGENVAALLDQRAKELPPPLFMCDGLNHNVPKGHTVVECNCLVHGRRRIVDQADSFPDECKYVLDRIAEVYAVEAVCREENLSPEECRWMHHLASAPVMNELHDWMTKKLEDKQVESSSGLGQAFNYMLERWEKMTVFLRVAGAPIDNNRCEQILKLAIVHRKNSLFYRNEHGAATGDIYHTLIHTAVIHGENPIDYLNALMSNNQAVAATAAEWMPWNYRQTLAKATATQTQSSQAQLATAAQAPMPTSASAPTAPTITSPDVMTPQGAASPPPPVDQPAGAPSEAASSTPSTSAPTAPTTTSPDVMTPQGAASPPPPVDQPAGAPSEAASSPSAVEPSTPQAKGKRLSRATRRPKSLIPPPPFALFTLLWLIMPFVASLYRSGAFVIQMVHQSYGSGALAIQMVHQSAACSMDVERLSSHHATHTLTATAFDQPRGPPRQAPRRIPTRPRHSLKA